MMDKIKSLFTDLKDSSAEYTKEEKDAGKLMAILSYIGILCLIPYFVEKDNKYVRYHAIQGLNLFIISLIISVAAAVVAFVGAFLAFIPVLGFILFAIIYVDFRILTSTVRRAERYLTVDKRKTLHFIRDRKRVIGRSVFHRRRIPILARKFTFGILYFIAYRPSRIRARGNSRQHGHFRCINEIAHPKHAV